MKPQVFFDQIENLGMTSQAHAIFKNVENIGPALLAAFYIPKKKLVLFFHVRVFIYMYLSCHLDIEKRAYSGCFCGKKLYPGNGKSYLERNMHVTLFMGFMAL